MYHQLECFAIKTGRDSIHLSRTRGEIIASVPHRRSDNLSEFGHVKTLRERGEHVSRKSCAARFVGAVDLVGNDEAFNPSGPDYVAPEAAVAPSTSREER